MAQAERDIALHQIAVCELCLNDHGGECHVPGCAFWMEQAPSGELLLTLRRAVPLTDGRAGGRRD